MICMRVNNKWYITKYTDISQVHLFDRVHAQILYDDELKLVVAEQIRNGTDFVNPPMHDQIKLELFLLNGDFPA